jgi:hypothetical protein
MDVPMLDEKEFAIVKELYRDGMRATKEFREKYGLSLDQMSIEDRFIPLLDAYEKITGFRETNPASIMHHRIQDYGLPCPGCGKVLRSPKAKICYLCGYIAT